MCCCRSDTAADAQPAAVSASSLHGSAASQTVSEAEVKSEPISPPPQPTSTQEMFAVRNAALLHGRYGSAQVDDGRFHTVAVDGRFHTSHAVNHRFQTSPECSAPTADASYRPLVCAHPSTAARQFHPNEPASQTTTGLFQPDVSRFHSGVSRFSVGMEPFRGRVPDAVAGNVVSGDRFQFLHPPRYLANGGDRFHAAAAHIGEDCIAGRFQLAAVAGGDTVVGAPVVAPSTNGPIDSVYHCHRDFDSSLYAAAKRPRLTADDWLC